MRIFLLSAAAFILLAPAHADARLSDAQSRAMDLQIKQSQCARDDNECRFTHGKSLFLMQADASIEQADRVIAAQRTQIDAINKMRAENKANYPMSYYDMLTNNLNNHIAKMETHKSELRQAKSLVSGASSYEQLQAAAASLKGMKAPQQAAAPAKPAPVAQQANTTQAAPTKTEHETLRTTARRRATQQPNTTTVAPTATTQAVTARSTSSYNQSNYDRRRGTTQNSSAVNRGSNPDAGEAAKSLINNLF